MTTHHVFLTALVGKAGSSAAFGPSAPPSPASGCDIGGFFGDGEEDRRTRTPERSDAVQSRSSSIDSDKTLVDGDDPVPPFTVDGSSAGMVWRKNQWRMTDRELYHRLQNLGQYPASTLAIARRRLLAEAAHIATEANSPPPSSILSLPARFDERRLTAFLQQQHDDTAVRFAQYSARRREAVRRASAAGASARDAQTAGCEMFDEGQAQCEAWLQRASVVKYVDGSWLAHLLRVTTGVGQASSVARTMPLEAQRRAARASWQVMSEELGDGDLARSHVGIYEALMDRITRRHGCSTPPKGEDRAFTQWAPAGETSTTGNERCWRAAIVQLSLSVSPTEFLPEALGFNMAYEGLPYHLLVSAREIEELLGAQQAYYFWLHVSIDNAASGHSAMARLAVVDFLHAAETTSGGTALADELWARIKLGYAMADSVPTTPMLDQSDDTPEHLTTTIVTREDLDADSSGDGGDVDAQRAAVVAILRAKATTASGMHSSVHAQMAGRTISDWLDPAHIDERAPQLVRVLEESPVWIKPGDAEGSRFVREFGWGGKMFGAMTSREVATLYAWVDSLGADKHMPTTSDSDAESSSRAAIAAYLAQHCPAPSTDWCDAELLRPAVVSASMSSWADLGREHYRALMKRPDSQRPPLPKQTELLSSLARLPASLPDHLTEDQIRALIPTLLTATAPLEHAISASCGKLSSPLGMACVKVLRVLHGFTEQSWPSSMGEGCHVGCMGTDDVEDQREGVWELAQSLHASLAGVATRPAGGVSHTHVALDELIDGRPAEQLGLPALVLQLGADVWTNMPVLLGMSSVVVSKVLCHQSLLSALRSDGQADRMRGLAHQASTWIDHAIQLGVLYAEERQTTPRGVAPCDWQAGVLQGQCLAWNGVLSAVDSAQCARPAHFVSAVAAPPMGAPLLPNRWPGKCWDTPEDGQL